MKIKIIKTSYDPDTLTSIVVINTDLGEFMGKARLHEEDKDIESSFAGYQYAEMRAIIKYMKRKAEIAKYKMQSLDNCIKSLVSKKGYEHNSLEARTLRKHYYIARKEKMDWDSWITSLHQKLYDSMKNRRKVVDEMKNKTKGDEK